MLLDIAKRLKRSPWIRKNPGGIYWQRMRDSNPRKRSQSPVCYRYTNPLSHGQKLLYAELRKSQALFSQFFIYFFIRMIPRNLRLIPPREKVYLSVHGT